MKIPCGRTKENSYLCCLRKHKWYNTYWIIRKLKWPEMAIGMGRNQYVCEKKCLFCGHTVRIGHSFKINVW